MKSFKEFIEIIKLPPSILSALGLVTGLILFLPDKCIKRLYLTEFKVKFGSIISLIFLISISMLIVLISITIFNKIKEYIKIRKTRKNQIKYLKELDELKTKWVKDILEKKIIQ